MKLAIVPLNSQVTALIQNGHRIGVHRINTSQRVGRSHFFGQTVQVVTAVLQQFDQESGCTGFEPVASEAHFGKRIEQAEGVVDVFTLLCKVIAVVHLFEFSLGFLFGQFVLFSQFDDVLLEVSEQFFFRNAAQTGKSFVDRDVHQVVQVAEHAHLAELGYSGQQGKLDVAVATLHHAVEGFQRVAVVGQQRFVADGLKHGFIVLVDEDDYVSAPFLCRTAYHSFKTGGKRIFVFIGSILIFPHFQVQGKFVFQCLGCIVLFCIEIKVQDGVFDPFLFQCFHGKSFEKFLFPLKVCFQGRDKQTLSESAGAAQEIILS